MIRLRYDNSAQLNGKDKRVVMGSRLKTMFIAACSLSTTWAGAEVLTPSVTFTKAPLQPEVIPKADQSILLGRSAFQANLNISRTRYEPLEDGGFRLGQDRNKWSFNRQIAHGRNSLLTGDLPIFKVETSTGSGVYASAEDRSFPLFQREDAKQSMVAPVLGTLMLGVVDKKGNNLWFDKLRNTVVEFRPGYTVYKLSAPDNSWTATLTIAPTMDFHGFVAKVEFDKPRTLNLQYSDIYWDAKEKNANKVKITKTKAVFTEANLPNGEVVVGWNSKGTATKTEAKSGEGILFVGSEEKKVHYVTQTWGVSEYDKATAETMMKRLDTANSQAWSGAVEEMKKVWFECFIGRALNPQKNFAKLARYASKEFDKTIKHWDRRRAEFQVKTPDPYVNAIVNFQRCISDYHKMGPGLVLSSKKWMMYSHISVGWYGKIWGGDHKTVADYMRFFGAMQQEDGFMRWVSPSLAPYRAENNTPYWVDHLWWLFAWTGDKKLLSDMWPLVKKAVEWEQTNNDPDGDGLFQSHYEYWNCDSNGKGPKAAAPTSTAWAMYDRASRMAAIMKDMETARQYRKRANTIQKAALSQLWNEEQGILGSIGANGIWRGHPQIWEQYLGIINGMLPIDKGRRAMRWLEEHYGFEPNKDINLLMSCDWWPLRWSVHWVPVGDNLLAAQAGLKCGDADLWWPYFKTVARSSFRSDAPAVRFGISNTGSGSAGVEFIDSDDPHMHATIRGLYGITPEIYKGKIHITPAFPSDWTEAQIKSPAVSYQYKRKGNKVIMKIITAKPLVKVVRVRFDALAVTTAKERVSTVHLTLPAGKGVPAVEKDHTPILTEKSPVEPEDKLLGSDRQKLVTMDLSSIYNTTLNDMIENTKFHNDLGQFVTIKRWWHTVSAKMDNGPETITADNGVDFLLKGRSESVKGKAKNILALSSWGKPYPLPAAAKISVNKKVDRLWVLMQNYVSPIKNYIPNGEIVLHYTTGKSKLISLVPPYNMDCYFQKFSREGTSVKLGELKWAGGWGPCQKNMCESQANALKIVADPKRTLKEIEIRATVSEGVVGINGITLLPAE